MVSSEAEIVERVRTARADRTPLEIVAAGTKRALGRTPRGAMLDVSDVTGIVSYEPEELLLTVKPGTPVAEVEALLAARGQRLGFDPADWGALLGAEPGRATIGGVLCADASGSAAMRYGRARDHLLGFRAINGFAEAYKAGGKVVKNVTGFDLPKLMCGAMGTLGVLTEVTVRVFPKPPSSQTFAARGLDAGAGLTLLRRVWSSPLEATGLAYANGAAFFRLEGGREPLTQKTALLRAMADVVEVDDPFRGIADGAAFADQPRDVWRVTLPPSRAAELVVEAPHWCADWAGGLVWIAGGEEVRATAQRLGGHAVLMRSARRDAPFPPEDAARAGLTRAVKAAFDPLRLFNPGRMYDGI
jgi:glycolate dehydrogenase FAD-binding subunit